MGIKAGDHVEVYRKTKWLGWIPGQMEVGQQFLVSHTIKCVRGDKYVGSSKNGFLYPLSSIKRVKQGE